MRIFRSGKSGLDAEVSFKDIVNVLDGFLMPIVEDILSEQNDSGHWRPGGPWTASPTN
jgi:hypothetical protein